MADIEKVDLESENLIDDRLRMLMYGKEASNRKQEIDRQHYTIPNQRPKEVTLQSNCNGCGEAVFPEVNATPKG